MSASAASTLQFTVPSYSVAESAGTALLTVGRTGDTNAAVGVAYATADGTGAAGLKYSAVSGTLKFEAGETNQTIVVPILNNGLVDGIKTFQVRLSDPTGGAVLGTRSNAVVAITDNDFGIQFQHEASSVSEAEGRVVLRVVRGDDGILPVTVGLFTTDGTARSGVDYTGVTNTLSFAAQERLILVSIPILNNNQKQPSRTFRVTLASPAGASLGSQKTATVTIADNDPGFQFDFASYSVAEDAGVVRIGVVRGTDDTNSAVTVDFATSDGSATSGLDYSGVAKTLAFAPGERVKQITVPILNDGLKEPTKNFSLTLSNPSGGAVLGSPATAAVTIVDNDPGVGFALVIDSILENAGVVALTVLRGNDAALGPISVDYATSDLTATAGQDYQAVSGTLAFGENETVKSLLVPILRNESVTKDIRFRVTLSNPTGGATLGLAATTVTIQNASYPGTFHAVAPRFDTALGIQRSGDVNTLTWAGGGQLQRADSPLGPWQELTSARSPITVPPSLPATFYRVTLPRPVKVYVPSSYNNRAPVPLVIMLHGYGGPSGGGDFEESYLKLTPLAEARGFLYCHPEAPADQANDQFWNATDGCCDLFDSGRDDAGYLRGLIQEIARQFAVDQKRVYLVGHSNGGFMAYRMACHSADLLAGIVSLAGMTFLDPSRCSTSQPVNILHIEGTADLFFYNGGAQTIAPGGFPANTPPFPGVRQTVQFWAGYNNAHDPVTDLEPSLNLDSGLAGLDTVITRYTSHPPGGAVELWTINGGQHYPTLSPEFSPRVIDWLLAHPKP